MTPDKFGWTIHMLKSTMWELLFEVEGNEQAITFYIPDKCPASHPICQTTTLEMNQALDKDKEKIGVAPNQQDTES